MIKFKQTKRNTFYYFKISFHPEFLSLTIDEAQLNVFLSSVVKFHDTYENDIFQQFHL